MAKNIFGDEIASGSVNAFGDPIVATDDNQPKQPAHPWLQAGADALVGAGRGIIKSVTGLSSLAAHDRAKMGMEDPQDSPAVQSLTTPTNTAQRVGMGAEQAAEFMIPGGAISKGAKAIEGATAGIRGARALNVAGRAALEATGAGAIAGAQTGGDPAAMRNAAVAAGGTSAALGGLAAAVPDKTALAKRLYGSALKPAPSLDAAERASIINTGLKEGIRLDPDVVQNVQKRISDINDQISAKIAEHAEAGAVVDPVAVAKYTDRSAQLAKTQVNPEADVAAVQGAKQEFLRSQSVEAPYTKVRPGTDEAAGTLVPEGEGSTEVPMDIPLDQAQRLKQGTYAKLKNSYGEQAGASREAQKDLARGLKDQIVKAFPEIAQLNAKEGALLGLEASLERFAGREGNKQLIGLGTPMTATAAHAMGAPVVPLTILKAALDTAEVKSRLAIALARAASGAPAQGVFGRGLAVGESAANFAPKAAAMAAQPSQPKQFPAASIRNFANQNGLTPLQARQQLIDEGWKIQGIQ